MPVTQRTRREISRSLRAKYRDDPEFYEKALENGRQGSARTAELVALGKEAEKIQKLNIKLEAENQQLRAESYRLRVGDERRKEALIKLVVAAVKRHCPDVHKRIRGLAPQQQVQYLKSQGWSRDRENMKGWWRRSATEQGVWPLAIAIRAQIYCEVYGAVTK